MFLVIKNVVWEMWRMTNGSVKAREGAFTHNLKIIRALRWCEGVKALFDFCKGEMIQVASFGGLESPSARNILIIGALSGRNPT